jgi:hypothetical protein
LFSASFVNTFPRILISSIGHVQVSIIEFDPSIQDVVTVGMYSLDHKAHSSAVFSHISTPQIRVDPLMRCAAVRFFNHLLVLPFSLSRNDFASAVLLPPTVQPSKVEEEAKLEFFKYHFFFSGFDYFHFLLSHASCLQVRCVRAVSSSSNQFSSFGRSLVLPLVQGFLLSFGLQRAISAGDA